MKTEILKIILLLIFGLIVVGLTVAYSELDCKYFEYAQNRPEHCTRIKKLNE